MSPSKVFEIRSLQPFYDRADELAREMHKYLDRYDCHKTMFPDVDRRAERFVNGLDSLLIDVKGDRL